MISNFRRPPHEHPNLVPVAHRSFEPLQFYRVIGVTALIRGCTCYCSKKRPLDLEHNPPLCILAVWQVYIATPMPIVTHICCTLDSYPMRRAVLAYTCMFLICLCYVSIALLRPLHTARVVRPVVSYSSLCQQFVTGSFVFVRCLRTRPRTQLLLLHASNIIFVCFVAMASYVSSFLMTHDDYYRIPFSSNVQSNARMYV